MIPAGILGEKLIIEIEEWKCPFSTVLTKMGGWVSRAERFFKINQMGEREKLDAVMVNMEGEALT